MSYRNYHEKMLKRFMEEHEDGDIALKICEIEGNYKLFAQILHDGENVKVRPYQDEDHGEVYITLDHGVFWVWRVVPYKANRYYYKIVPQAQLDRETIADILEAQPWIYM